MNSKTILLLSALLATSLQGQTILLSESFDNGWPESWTKRFGTVTDGRFNFNNRSTNFDTLTSPIDFSVGGHFTLSFNFQSGAGDSHNLLIGLWGSGTGTIWFAGSPFAALGKPLETIFSASEGQDSHNLEIGPWLAYFQPSELSGLRIAFVSLNGFGLSSEKVWIDDVRVQLADAQAFQSAIPEPECACVALGAVVLLVAWLKRRATT